MCTRWDSAPKESSTGLPSQLGVTSRGSSYTLRILEMCDDKLIKLKRSLT